MVFSCSPRARRLSPGNPRLPSPGKQIRQTKENRWRRASVAQANASAQSSSPRKALVLGGSGFVGGALVGALLDANYAVVTVSRREAVKWAADDRVTSLQRDLVKDSDAVNAVIADEGPFDAVFHCIGMLLANDLNALASGSASKPAPGSTYNQVTRETAVAAADAAVEMKRGCPFVFVSAAEVAWSEDRPLVPGFLKAYLAAKRAVEAHLMDLNASGALRAVMLRPSLVWTPERPAAVPPVLAFTLANRLGNPGVDKPVRVEVLAKAAVAAVGTESARGIWRYMDMEAAAAQLQK